MTQKPDGGPAYPHQFEDIHGHPQWMQSQGMSLRDYFAGQALTGYLSGKLVEDGNPIKYISHDCYFMADAMIAAREVNT